MDLLPQVTSSTLRVYPNRCQHFPPFKLNCIFALSVHFSWYATHLSVFNCLFPLVNFKLIVFLQWRGHCMVILWNLLSCISRLIRIRWPLSSICVMREVAVVVRDFQIHSLLGPSECLWKHLTFKSNVVARTSFISYFRRTHSPSPTTPQSVFPQSSLSLGLLKSLPAFSRIPVNCEVYQHPVLRHHLQASARRRRNTISSPDSALQTE